MPRYDYNCPICKTTFESFNTIDNRHNCKCEKCGADATFIPITTSNVQRELWIGGWYEDFGPKPIYVRDKGELAHLCKKHNVVYQPFAKVPSTSGSNKPYNGF